MMYLTWLTKFILWVVFAVTGPIGYFLARYAHIGESVWGNSKDGYCGNQPYKDNEAKAFFRKLWPCFWWSVIRNPANNFTRSVAYGEIIAVSTRGHLTKATLRRDNKEQRVWFFYTPDWPVLLKFGYKIWPSYMGGDTISAKLAFSVQRGNRIV